jgi:AcrR family transcriptional regulator
MNDPKRQLQPSLRISRKRELRGDARRKALAKPRPARGKPADTRERLVAQASLEIEAHGYFGTDTNRIARAAGYAPGTFYKHFTDKRAIFLAVYDEWVSQEWTSIEALARREGTRQARVTAVVEYLAEHHRRFRGFRAALRALVATDPLVRKHHRAVRARQLGRFQALGPAYAEPGAAGLAMLTVERVCDAIADDELEVLGLTEDAAKRALVRTLLA